MREEKVKVLIGANDLSLAGVQRLVVDQLSLLDRERFELSLVVLMQFPGRETFRDRIPKDVRVFELSFSGFLDIPSWLKLVRILGKERPQVVKTATFFSNTVFLLLKPFFGYAVIAAEHNTVRRKPFFERLMDRLLFPLAYTIIGDSQSVVEFMAQSEGINPKRFTILYNGADIVGIKDAQRLYANEREELRKTYGIPSHAHVFFTAGRLVQQKNHALMLEAFARIVKDHPDAYLLIAGDGKLKGDLESQITKLGLTGRAILLGERKDVYRFYNIADTFLLTSHHEGFCIAAVEGLAFGLPLISTDVAGVREYLLDGGNGFFTTHEQSDIVEKLRRVLALNLEERTRFSKAAQATAVRYDLSRYGREFNRLVGEAAS